MVSTRKSRSLLANTHRTGFALVLAALLALPLAALAPAAAAEASTITTLSDGSTSTALLFEHCGSAVDGVYVAVPFNAVVDHLNFTLSSNGTQANQVGWVAAFVGGLDGGIANVSVNLSADISVGGESVNAYLHGQNASSGEVLVPLAFVGCSLLSNWSVDLENLVLTYHAAPDVAFTVDTPAAALTYTSASNFTVSGTVSPADCTVFVNDAEAHLDGASPTANWSAVIALQTGENGVRAVACENLGAASVIERTIVRDEGSVNLSIEAPPAHTSTNQTNVTVSGTTDPGASVQVNGVNVTVNGTTGAFEVVVQLESTGNVTENVISIVARDGLGGERWVNLTVIVDLVAPTIDLHLGADLAAAIEAGLPVHLAVIRVAGSTDSEDATITVNGEAAVREGLTFVREVAVASGENTITVVAVDHAGNRREVSFTVLVDNDAPSIDLDLDANVSAAIEAGTAIHQTTLEIRGSTDSEDAVIVVNGHEANQTGLNFTFTVELADGLNTIVIVAEDHAGNRREVSLVLLVDLSNPPLAVTLDATAREAIAGHRPTRTASVAARVESNATTVRFTLNGNLMSEWSGSMNLSITLSEGENTLLFEAIEGEVSSHETITLTLDTTAPTLYAQLNNATEDNGTWTASSRLLSINGTTEGSAAVKLCTAGPEANSTVWCHAVDVADSGNFHGQVELDAHGNNTVTVVATDHAGNTNTVSFTVVYSAPDTTAHFGNDTALAIHIGGTHEGEIVAGSDIVLEVGSEAAIPDGANVSWYVDGVFAGSGRRLGEVNLSEGNHTIEVVVTTDSAQASTTREVNVDPAALRATPGLSSLLGPMLFLGLFVAGAVVANTDRGRYLLMGALLGSVFTRLKKPAPLDHFVRGRLFQLVSDEPGVHYAELKRRANLSNGVVAHHLRVLETAGILRTVQDGTKTRFYPTDQPMDRETYGLSDGDRAVLDTVTAAPGITEGELSEKVGKSLSTVSRSVDRMAALGYVTTTRQGRTVSVFPRAGNEGPAAGAVALPDEV